MAEIKEPVDRELPSPPEQRDPARRKTPIEEPPPTPRDQPDGTGEPDVPDVNENGEDPINPPVDEPARDGND